MHEAAAFLFSLAVVRLGLLRLQTGTSIAMLSRYPQVLDEDASAMRGNTRQRSSPHRNESPARICRHPRLTFSAREIPSPPRRAADGMWANTN